jgi:hypothetical protein
MVIKPHNKIRDIANLEWQYANFPGDLCKMIAYIFFKIEKLLSQELKPTIYNFVKK